MSHHMPCSKITNPILWNCLPSERFKVHTWIQMCDGPLLPGAGFQTGNLSRHHHFYLTDELLQSNFHSWNHGRFWKPDLSLTDQSLLKTETLVRIRSWSFVLIQYCHIHASRCGGMNSSLIDFKSIFPSVCWLRSLL